MSIADRYWGTQVASGARGATHCDPIARGLDAFGLVIADAASVARLKGWTEVTITRNADGYAGLVGERS